MQSIIRVFFEWIPILEDFYTAHVENTSFVYYALFVNTLRIIWPTNNQEFQKNQGHVGKLKKKSIACVQ